MHTQALFLSTNFQGIEAQAFEPHTYHLQGFYRMIKIEIEPTKQGYLLLCPVSPKVRKRVGLSNAYDGSFVVFLDCPCEFLNRLKRHQLRMLKFGYKINILMDEWEYRHMVGGQSD